MTDEELAAIENIGIRNDILDDVLSIIIHAVEEEKAEQLAAYEAHKNVYLNNRYRSAGLTKRQIEDKMQRINGRILGIESALSTLYQLKARTENSND